MRCTRKWRTRGAEDRRDCRPLTCSGAEVIAMRCWGVKQGARKLGVRHSSLSEWTRNEDRKLST